VSKPVFSRWRGYFFTGLVVLLPAIITLALLKWLIGTVASLTDLLLFFAPSGLTHADGGRGEMYWYWRLAALALAIVLVTLVGLLARYYLGKRAIEWFDAMMLRVPLLNKIYGSIKQVNEAFTVGKKTSFQTVVLVEFPREGTYAVGFVTSEQDEKLVYKSKEKLIGVFVPTTPIPTSGFRILVPEAKVTKLDMSVAEGIKYIISFGSVSPEAATEVKNVKRSKR